MRKLLFFAALAYVASCKAPAVSTSATFLPPVPGASLPDKLKDSTVANEMHDKYRKHFNKRAQHAFTRFNRQELINALQRSNEDSVDFIIGMYSKKNAQADTVRRLAIILKAVDTTIKDKGIPVQQFYTSRRICPPPQGSCW